MPSLTARTAQPGLPRIVLILVGGAAAVAVVAGMRGVSGLLAPLLLALVLTVLVHPLRRWLDRWMPGWAASAICTAAVYLLILVLALSVLVSAARFAMLLPSYTDEAQARVSDLTSWMGSLGVDKAEVQKVGSSFDIGSVTAFITSLLQGLVGLVTDLFFIFSLVLFMTVDATTFPRQLERARAVKPEVVGSLEDFAHGTRRYLGVSTVFGLIVAVLDTAALIILGVPLAATWGLLAFITNYIPNIGFVIGLIPPAIIALLEGGPSLMLAVIAVYCVLNVVIQSVIQPKVVGDAVGLSTTLSFFSLVFWTWVIGPLGAILAIPLTLLIKALLVDSDPSLRWLQPLISNKDQPTTSPASEEPASEEPEGPQDPADQAEAAQDREPDEPELSPGS